MRYFKKIFIVSLLGWLILVGTAKGQTDGLSSETVVDEGITCTDPNDLNTCYSDPDWDLKQILDEGEVKTPEPTQQEADEAFVNQVRAIKNVSGDLNPLKITGPEDIFSVAINVLMMFIGSLSLVLYIYAGLMWMSAGGNAEKVTKAKSILVWTTLGLIAMGGSYMVVQVVLNNIG
jgi:hypothetical protein